MPAIPAYFFFSSRRRHTRYWRDWSSDVCSSDLARRAGVPDDPRPRDGGRGGEAGGGSRPRLDRARSEERRVGKECRSRWWPDHEKKKGRRGLVWCREGEEYVLLMSDSASATDIK